MGNALVSQSREIPQVSEIGYDTTTVQVGPSSPAPSKRRRWPLLWGMGGTIVSVFGFILLTLFEQYNGLVGELRADLKHFNETSSEFVRKDTLQRVRDQVKECFKEMQASGVARAQLEMELKASEKARDQLVHELQQMRERLAYLEGRQTVTGNGQSAPGTHK
jgi:hypothetical protein